MIVIRKEHLKIVAKEAWSFHYTTRVEFDELYGEGCLAYCEYLGDYNPSRDGKISTFITRHVRNRLINFTKRINLIKTKFQPMPAEDSGWEYGENDPVNDFNGDLNIIISTAPEDVQDVVNLILDNPMKYGMQKPRFARGQVRDDLLELGWDWNRIGDAIRNTKAFVSENLSNCII